MPLLLLDAVLAVLTAICALTSLASVGAPLTWDGTIPVAIALGLLLLARRRGPVVVLALSAAVLLGAQYGGLFEGGVIWPMTVAVFTAGLANLPWTAAICVLTLAAAVGPTMELARGGAELLWLALVLALAHGYRQHLRWRAEHEARLREAAGTRLAEQRLQIARELHDVVAHTLTVVGLHLNVAAEADSLPEAKGAIRVASDVRKKAMADLRSLIGVLRDVSGEPQPELSSIADLVARAREAGLDVTLDEGGDPTEVPAAQAMAAFRIVQEAMTNALKHSDARRLLVHLDYSSNQVRVEVVDDGTGPVSYTEGHGLTGMRERVTALGGWLEIEAGDGFAVRAGLPV
ncbi:sensor histidine kinase [Nonomuraea sp. bgisy101]|uniref:sensor histidine kinase n=1 Tax=Nonomuraea sp. bgisy101 TaxID=3413784 RepID=UPI003D73DBDD